MSSGALAQPNVNVEHLGCSAAMGLYERIAARVTTFSLTFNNYTYSFISYFLTQATVVICLSFRD